MSANDLGLARVIERTREAICLAAGPGLDEWTRERMAAELAPSLDRIAVRFARSRGGGARRALRLVVGLWATAVAAAALLIGLGFAHRRAQAPAVALAPRPIERLVPYVAGGGAVERFADVLGQAQGELEVPRGGLVRAALGARTTLTLIGPGRILVERGASEDETILRLSDGLVLGQYDHGAGGRLRIVCGRTEATITGTLFAVDGRPGAAGRVAVAQGEVQVKTEQGRQRVASGQQLEPGGSRLEPLSPALESMLREHGAWTPPSEPAGLLQIDGALAHAWPQSQVGAETLGPLPVLARLAAGSARITLQAPGATPLGYDVQVLAGQTVRLDVTLAPGASHVAVPRSHAEAAPAAPVVGDATNEAEELYLRAEAAMRRGDRGNALGWLAALCTRFPKDPRAEVARYERARLLLEGGQCAEADEALAPLLGGPSDYSLLQGTRYLACRIDLSCRREARAAACLRDFRADFPQSPRDGEALALLADFAERGGGCQAARALLEEYVRRYAGEPFFKEAQARLSACER